MKILRIGIQNLNSLRGTHQIDFSRPPLADHPLYAIVGPTGSGKTTILDAITLALYGQTERTRGLTDHKKEVATVMTHGTGSCYAELEFSTPEGRYRSVWRRRRAHGKAHKKLQGKQREIGKWNATTESYDILATKTRDVDRVTEQVTGLTYDRFVRSVMLTQGDFDRFLKSDAEKKAAILEQITGTEIYRQLSIAAFQRHKEARENYERRAERLNSQLPLRTEERTQLEERVRTQAAEVATLKRKLDRLAEEQRLHREVERATAKLSEASERLQRAGEEWKAAAKDREVLSRSESLEPLRGELATERTLTQQLTEGGTRREAAAGQLRLTEQQLTAARQAVEKARSQLTEYRLGEPERDRKLSAAEVLESEIRQYDTEAGKLTVQLTDEQQHLSRLAAEGEVLEQEVQSLIGQLGQINEATLDERIEMREEQLPRWARQLDRLENQITHRTIENRRTQVRQQAVELEKELSEQQRLEATHATVFKQAQQAVDVARLRHQNAQLRASLEDHRSAMEDGKPCPLCGSLHHPYLAEPSPSESEIEALQRELTSAQEELTQADNASFRLSQSVHQLEQRLTAVRTTLHNLTEQLPLLTEVASAPLPDLERQRGNLQQQMETGRKQLSQWRQLRPLLPRLAIKRNELGHKLAERDRHNKQVAQLTERNQEIAARLRTAKDEITTLIGSQTSTEGRRANQRHEQNLSAQLSSKEKQLAEISSQDATHRERHRMLDEHYQQQDHQLGQLRGRLLDSLTQFAYPDIERARADLLTPERTSTLRARIQRLDQQRETAAVLLEQAKQAVTAARANAVDLPPADTVELELRELASLQSAADQALGALKNQITNDDALIVLVAERQQKLEQSAAERDRWARLDELIGSAKGKKFQSFAQSITLQRLVTIGNRHLATINPRYRMVYAPPSPGAKEELDLEIIDTYMNDNRRTVETLSGGETFLISLALALGLSDLASGKQLIQSLFIDEGFGTLDGKTLDQAMATLEQLQAQGKTIGIISHVQQLRERVSGQIQLEPVGDGFSRIVLAN